MTNRERKEAAKRLALSLQMKYRNLIDVQFSGDGDAIINAALPLADEMNSQSEFIICCLKAFSGMDNINWPEPATRGLPKTPSVLLS